MSFIATGKMYETFIASHHRQETDELPFKRFLANVAFDSCMLIAFFLVETSKKIVLVEMLPITPEGTMVGTRQSRQDRLYGQAAFLLLVFSWSNTQVHFY